MKQGSRKHSIAKAFTWRIVATADTILITWLVTGQIHAALAVGGFECVTKMVIYYVHERAWQQCTLDNDAEATDWATAGDGS